MKRLLLLFQNMHGWGRVPLVYDTRIINRRNATYARVVPYLEPHFELRFAECTPRMGRSHRQKFPTDPDWVRRAIDKARADHVIAFGTQAREAMRTIGVECHALPHPVSFRWRRDLIEGLVELLNTTAQETTR